MFPLIFIVSFMFWGKFPAHTYKLLYLCTFLFLQLFPPSEVFPEEENELHELSWSAFMIFRTLMRAWTKCPHSSWPLTALSYTILTFTGSRARQHVGSQLPDQGLNLYSLHWKYGILANGPPGESLISSFLPLDFCFSNSLQLSSLTSPVFLLHGPNQIQSPFWNLSDSSSPQSLLFFSSCYYAWKNVTQTLN